MPEFQLKILGDPVILGPQGPMAGRVAYRRRLALLAVLALARGRPVGRERLIGLLWPELPDEAARHNLSESLYVLRKELGEGAIAPVGSDLALNPEVVASDVAEFEAALEAGDAEAAARAYGGPLLGGFYVPDAPEFERWAEGERDRLARLHARALESLAEAAEAEGSAIRAVDWWRRLAAADPFSSRTALRLVRALDAAGERPSALRYADTHAALLREELGVDPDPDLAAFVASLRTASPRPAAPPPPLPRFSAAAAPPSANGAGVAEPGRAGDAETGTAPSPADGGDRTDALRPPAAVEAEALEPAADESGTAAPDSPAPSPSPARFATSPSFESPDPAPLAGRVPEDAAAGLRLPAPAGARGRRSRARAFAGSAGVAGVLLGVAAALAGDRPRTASEATPQYDPRRVAVLYFDDLSPHGELRYLAAGLTDMLIHDLGQVPALDVVSRGGVKPYRDRAVRFDSMAADLRAGTLVEGTVQPSRDSVFVTVEMVDANTGAQLGSRQVARAMGDVVELERAVADEVAAFLRRRLGREIRLRQVREETRSARAADLVLKAEEARDEAARIGASRDSLDALSATRLLHSADSLLAAAERADPAWSRPVLLRGWVELALSARAEGRAQAALRADALARAGRVLAREPGNAAALELRGTSRFTVASSGPVAASAPGMDAAERDLRAAVAAEPSRATAWSMLSFLLRVRGRFAESDQTARRALAEDAYLDDAAAIRQRLAFSAMSAGDYAQARDECARGQAQFPADWRFVECRLTLLRQDPAQPPDPALAWRLVAELERLDPPGRAAAEGRTYSPLYRPMVAAAVSARAGEVARARAVLARTRALATTPDLRLSLDYDEAYLRLLLGERDSARARLDEMLAARPWLRPYVARDPLFRGLVTPAAPPARGRASPPPPVAPPASRG